MSLKNNIIRACTVHKDFLDYSFVFDAWLCVEDFEQIDDKVAALARCLPPEIFPVLSFKAQQLLDFLGNAVSWTQMPLAPNPEDNLTVPREFIEVLVRIGDFKR